MTIIDVTFFKKKKKSKMFWIIPIDDLCILSVPLKMLTKARKLAWEKMLPFKGKQYTANIVSKEVDSLDQCRKLSNKAAS